jgi:hypothetical protein
LGRSARRDSTSAARVAKYFGRRRVFASLETTAEARGILSKLVEAFGVPPVGDEVTLLRLLETRAAARPLAAILDNAETAFETDREEAERVLRLVAQVPGLTILVTIRGVAPSIAGAKVVEDLSKLEVGPAREAFLAVAGDFFMSDRDLAHLLVALDGHALSLRLRK